MGRKRTRLALGERERAELRQLLRTTADPRARERVRVALWAASGQHTLEDLAEQAGRARATIQNWLGKFSAGGIAGLLARDTPPGSRSPIAGRLVQRQLRVGLKAGRWHSAREVAEWLAGAHGIRRARKSIYYWLAKRGGRGKH